MTGQLRRQGEVVDRQAIPLVTSIGDHREAPLICAPTDDDVARFGRLASERMCGNCRSFDLELGQRECARDRFWSRIRHEHGWAGQSAWTGPLPNYGLCGYYGCPVFMFASADLDPTGRDPDVGCDFWRVGYGKVIRSVVRGLTGL